MQIPKNSKKRDGALHAARLQDSARPRLLGLGHFQETPETDELSKKYDLFLRQAVAAWGDERVYQNGRPDFEHAPKEMRTTHYVSGGRFFLLGEAVDVEPTAQ